MNEITRRRLMTASVATLPLAAILADPRLAAIAAETTETITTTLAGGQVVSAALAVPATVPAGGIVLIHEFWGLNDQIKTMAVEFAREGYVAIAADLYGGKVGTTREAAMALRDQVVPAVATETLVAWIDWLRADGRINGKVGTCGWCFGGAWSLNASVATPVEATVIYYGRVPSDPAVLAKLKGPVLGHFGERDQNINHAMVDPFEAALAALGKPHEIHWYDADHAFANPTGERYDQEDAKLAWSRTLEFLDAKLS